MIQLYLVSIQLINYTVKYLETTLDDPTDLAVSCETCITHSNFYKREIIPDYYIRVT